MASAQTDCEWLALYKKAISEPDPDLLMARLAIAHKAIQERTRDLWRHTRPEVAEQEHLTAAAHYLEILRSLVDRKGRTA